MFDVLESSCDSSIGNFRGLPRCLIALIVLTIASICAITKSSSYMLIGFAARWGFLDM